MKWALVTLCLGLCFCMILGGFPESYTSACAFEGRVRHVPVDGDQIVTVHTAVGIATLIQVPDTPSSVVVGDQEGFRVEYLDRAITIKPLRQGARSNLYVYTDFKRYNVQLATGSEGIADYVVYLEASKPSGVPAGSSKSAAAKSAAGLATRWTRVQRRLRLGDFKMWTTRLGRSPSGVLLIEFEVTAGRSSRFEPEWIWLTQEGRTRPIQNLFLSKVEASSGSPIRGVLQIRKSDIEAALPLRVELRREKTAFLILPGVTSWK